MPAHGSGSTKGDRDDNAKPKNKESLVVCALPGARVSFKWRAMEKGYWDRGTKTTTVGNTTITEGRAAPRGQEKSLQGKLFEVSCEWGGELRASVIIFSSLLLHCIILRFLRLVL
jgi:hypothetical protein